MARIIRNSDGKITAVNPLEIQGFPDLSDCDVSERRAVCFLSETEYLVANGETVERRAVPTGISANSVRMLDDTTLIVVDKHAAVLTSRDDGKTWKQYAGPPRANPLSRARMVRLLKGKDRYYLYSSHAAADETFVLSADYATNTYEQFPLRPKTKRIDGLYETDYGLYLDPWNAGFFSDTLYVYPWSTKTWESRDLPMNCSGLRFVDRSGMRIDTTCHGGYAIPFRTEDGGHTWGRG
jgi:hypothetical protein